MEYRFKNIFSNIVYIMTDLENVYKLNNYFIWILTKIY